MTLYELLMVFLGSAIGTAIGKVLLQGRSTR